MNDNLDRWIKDARDEVPDPGEFRRLNRAMLKERMLTVKPHAMRKHRLLVTAACLVLVVGLSGQISQLGSDDFEIETSTTELASSGDTVALHSRTFKDRGLTNLPEDFTEADIDEYFQMVAAGEGEIVAVIGTGYGGKTNWLKIVRLNINGKVDERGYSTQDPPSESLKNEKEFYLKFGRDLTARTKAEPPHGHMRMPVDGVLMEIDSWTFAYPGYGEVTYYHGVPATAE